MEITQVSDILKDAGYPVVQSGNYIQTAAIWRQGTDNTSVVIYPNDNKAKDFVSGETFNLEELFRRVFSVPKEQNMEDFLKTKNFKVNLAATPAQSQIKQIKIFDSKLLENLLPIYDYYTSKGLAIETLRLHKAGLAIDGKLKNRFVFPVENSKGQIVGFAGRSIEPNPVTKWKILGDKSHFVYNMALNFKEVKVKNQIIIVESIFDYLCLWQCGYRNVVVTFGTELSFAIINFLLKINISKIIISLNNDESGVGNNASDKMYNKLLKYFDRHQIKILLPQSKKDWGEVFELGGKALIDKEMNGK